MRHRGYLSRHNVPNASVELVLPSPTPWKLASARLPHLYLKNYCCFSEIPEFYLATLLGAKCPRRGDTVVKAAFY